MTKVQYQYGSGGKAKENKVGVDQRFAVEPSDDGHEAEKDSKGNLQTLQGDLASAPGAGGRMASGAFAVAGKALAEDVEEDEDAESSAEERGRTEDKDGERRAEKCACHRHQLYIAKAHSINLAQLEINPADEVENARADDGSDHGVRQRSQGKMKIELEKRGAVVKVQREETIGGAGNRDKKAEDESHPESGECHGIGQEVSLSVGEGESDEQEA